MSIKRDSSGRRSIEAEVEVPGTPEEVWEAIATGPGISSWFYPAEVEGRVGGVMRYHTGSKLDPPGTVTVWDPPRRFATEGRDCGPEGPPTAAEWTITARSGGTCLVRVVHSLFADTDDWDDQLKSFEAGWPCCFEVLRSWLTHFRGQRASILRAEGAVSGSAEDAWAALLGALGGGGLTEGRGWNGAPGAPAISGVVERILPGIQPFALLRLDRPAPGLGALSAYRIAERATVALWIYLYGGDAPAAAAREEGEWKVWMKARFP